MSLPHSFPELAGAALLGACAVAAAGAVAVADGFTGAAGALEAGAGDAAGAAEGAVVVFSGATGDFSDAAGLAEGAGSALGTLGAAAPLVADAACDDVVGEEVAVAGADEDGVDVDQEEEAAGVAAFS